jgi:dihydroorotate dehydrogenase
MSAPTRTAPIAPQDYVTCAAALAPHADYLVCNVSSPNTPGLRTLQGRVQLNELLKRVQDAIAAKPVPLLVKIAPDGQPTTISTTSSPCAATCAWTASSSATRHWPGRPRCDRRVARKPAACRASR